MNNRPLVPVLDTAIRILYELANSSGEATSAGLARKVGASQPTCYRILKTLEAADWIRANDRNGYDLSIGLLPLAKGLIDLDRFGRVAAPLLKEVSTELELSAKFSVRQDMEQVTLAVAQPLRPFGISATVGARFPVVCGASGASLLATLSEKELEKVIEATSDDDWEHESAADLRRRVRAVRRYGVCENRGKHPQGIDTISAPVRTERITSAVTLIGLRGDIHRGNLASLKKRLIATATAMEERLG